MVSKKHFTLEVTKVTPEMLAKKQFFQKYFKVIRLVDDQYT